MQREGIRARGKKKFVVTTDSAHTLAAFVFIENKPPRSLSPSAIFATHSYIPMLAVTADESKHHDA